MSTLFSSLKKTFVLLQICICNLKVHCVGFRGMYYSDSISVLWPETVNCVFVINMRMDPFPGCLPCSYKTKTTTLTLEGASHVAIITSVGSPISKRNFINIATLPTLRNERVNNAKQQNIFIWSRSLQFSHCPLCKLFFLQKQFEISSVTVSLFIVHHDS